MKKKNFKTIKDYLATCSEDEKKFIYKIYQDMRVDICYGASCRI